MLRLWLESEDLARVIIARGTPPMGVAVLAAQALAKPNLDGVLDRWRAGARRRVTPSMTPLLDLVGHGRYIPDFLTPYSAGWAGVEGQIDTVLATPQREVRAQLARAFGRRLPPSWTKLLADDDGAAWAALATAARDFHDQIVAPDLSRLEAGMGAETAALAHTLATEGVAAALSALHPRIRWSPPVLEIETLRGGEVRLGGRGLQLWPSAFVWPTPRVLLDHEGPAVLVYPVPPPAQTAGIAADPVADLLGRTRAAVLRAVVTGDKTTSGLARELDISAASASEHAAVLRNAGLLCSIREGRAVCHRITPLGTYLLRPPAF
ncbi:DUF5937 family protein [Nocardia sp. NPDC127526]|uniref:DUF5937 family protein n=1 Tax=Nocardia sp. NPDC127526 TaxID=3345393 RepID=UPI003643F773